MTDKTAIGLPEAARRLGVPLHVLRHAIRTGKLSAPAHLNALSSLSDEWLAGAQAKVAAEPKTFSRASSQKVAAYARYEGTSAWQKFRRRARAYAHYRAALRQKS